MKLIIIASMLALSVGACSPARQNRDLSGAAIGGVGGAIIGGVASRSAGGAVVGGVIGAAGGALLADATRPRHHRHCYYSDRLGRSVCR